MAYDNALFQSGIGLLAGSMPNSGFSPWAAGLQGAQSGMAMDRDAEARQRWEALIAGQGQPSAPPGSGGIPSPAALNASVPPITGAGGPIPQVPGGVPSSASLRQRFAQQPGQAGFPGAAAPSAQPSVASTSRGQGLGSEYWREFGLRKPPGAPAGAPPALTAARGGPAGVQVAALGPIGGGGFQTGMRGAATGQATQAGRQIYTNPQGQQFSERSITVTHPSINGGAPTNIPSVFGGQIVPEDEAIRRVAAAGGVDPATGRPLQGFGSIQEAVAAAKARSGGLQAQGSGGGAVTLAPQAQPQQALGVSPGPGTGLQGLLASLDPTTRQMVAQLGPEQGAPLLMSMLAQRNKTTAPPADVAEYQYAKSNGFQGSYLDFKRELAQTTATPTAPKQQPIQILQAARDALPQGDPNRAELQARINKINAEAKGVIVNTGDLSKFGKPEPGYVWARDNAGEVVLEPDPDSGYMRPVQVPLGGGSVVKQRADEEAKAAAEAEAEALRAGTQLKTDLAKAETMLDATGGIREAFEGANTPVTGTGSGLFAQFSSTPAGRVRSYVDTLQSGTVLGTMQELKKASSSGATGFGALNERELDLMISAIGALNPDTTDPDIFLKTIDRIESQYNRVIQDIQKNVSPERIRELGLEELIAKAGDVSRETQGNGAVLVYDPETGEFRPEQ